MKKYLFFTLFSLIMGIHLMAFGSPVKDSAKKALSNTQEKPRLKQSAQETLKQNKALANGPVGSQQVRLQQPAYPWEIIKNQEKTFRYVVMNFYTDLFDPQTVFEVAKNVEAYVAEFVFPSWRHKISVEFFIPPSQQSLADQGLLNGTFINALPQPGTFIPIVLTNDFSSNIPNNFASAVHGNVSGSPTTGYNASLYLDGDSYTLTGPFPFGTPFIVIPAGSAESGNGIRGLIAANKESGQGPTSFYQALSLVISQEVISTLIDPSAAQYVGSGNPLGGKAGGPLPDGTSGVTTEQIFHLRDATSPFLYGNDNTFKFNNWTVGNFALPAYFMSHDNSGCYDLLGRTCAPLTPYKGSQFVVYQDFHVTDYPKGEVTDLLVGSYISPLAHPKRIKLLEEGSIYDFTGWGEQILSDSPKSNAIKANANNSAGNLGYSLLATTIKNIPTVNSSPVTNGRNRNSKQFHEGTAKAKNAKKCSTCIKSKKPRLLPFQYIDDKGFLTTRFAIINYIPDLLPPEEIEKSLPVMEKYLTQQYLPFYNNHASIVNYTVLPGDVGLPEFDGTFIPFFLLNPDQFDLSQLGSAVISGGAINVNNVPNILAGPEINQYLKATADFSLPNLPIANPYLMISQTNFPGQVIVTTDQPGLGPFIAIPTSSSVLIPTTFPIVALGEDANPLDACTPLKNDLTGKIGVNLRTACNSLVYPNIMAAAGAIAFLTVFDPGARVFSATGAKIWGATLGPDGNALISALASNPNITITISAPEFSVNDINAFTAVCTHEMEELMTDPNYATYLLTFNPNVDKAVLFSQLEASDPTENLNVFATKNGNSYEMECFPLPSYFVAYLRDNNYDNSGVVWRPLVPESRQQIVFHFKSKNKKRFNPLHWGNTLGPTENGGLQELILEDFGGIFTPSSFGYPTKKPSVSTPVVGTPLDTIYEALMNLRDVEFI